ncbi:lymphokine-activated killer T-cell-originated protein kinase homolog [Aplochiton taeniatus]
MATSSTDDVGMCKTPPMTRTRSRLSGSDSGPATPVTIPTSPFMQKLGNGTGVNVYLMNREGKLNASPWAVKKINRRCEGNQAKIYQERLTDEATILRELKHPNIVGFRAFTTANDGSKCLAMEYGGEQSLNDLLEKRREEGQGPFPPALIEKVALHMARGLQYLHNEKNLLHGNVKSRNVVIMGDFDTVKLCDVGVSLKLDENMRVSDPDAEYIGTEPWTPKEALQDGPITDKSDIFAYGLTLWEMMTLSIPHMEMLDNNSGDDEDSMDEEDFDEEDYYKKLGTRPPLDPQALDQAYRTVVELFCLCTEEDPHLRPSAAQIVQALEANGSLGVNGSQEVIVRD